MEKELKLNLNDEITSNMTRKAPISIGKKMKNLENDISETESYSPQKKIIQLKSLSTRHAGPTDALSFEQNLKQ